MPFAKLAAIRREGPVDHAIRLVFTTVIGIPTFWMGIILALLLQRPDGGSFPWAARGTSRLDTLWHLTLPALTIGLHMSPILVRALRRSLIEVMSSDYVTTGVAMGLRPVTRLVSYLLAERPDAVRLDPGPEHRLADRRHDHHRAGLRRSGGRVAPDHVDPDARLLHHPVRRARSRRTRDPRQPLDRPHLRPAGPAGVLPRMKPCPRSPRWRVRGGRHWIAAGGWSLRVGLVGSASDRRSSPSWRRGSRRTIPRRSDWPKGSSRPALSHWFGTDQLGRDILTRVLHAARTDLQIGTIGVIIPLMIGAVLGLFAGYYAGWPDAILGRVVDVVTAFPFLVLVLAIVAMLGPGLTNFYIAITAGQLGGVRANRARRGAQRAGSRLHPRRAEPRLRRPAHHVPPPAAERDGAGLRLRDERLRARHPGWRLARLLRARRAAPDARVGGDDRRGPQLHPHRSRGW